MIVAHGTWLPNKQRFFLWGESLPVSEIKTSNGSHPYQLESSLVEAELLAALSDEDVPTDSEASTVTLLLPTDDSVPVPSPEHSFHPIDTAVAKLYLSNWNICGLDLTPGSAFSWLSMLPSEDTLLPQRISLGSDLMFWSSAARLGLEMLARQRFLPSLVGNGYQSEARWKLLIGEELDRIEALSLAMPPVCRSFAGGEARRPDELLLDFLNATTDHFVRRAASRLRLRPRFVETSGEQFASSLVETDATFEGTDQEVQLLKEDLSKWRPEVDGKKNMSFRIAFRLVSPEISFSDNDESVERVWALSYFLQALDDESVLVPLARVWEHGGASLKYLERRLERPQEFVLEGLGLAAALFQPIEESLKQSRPELCMLDEEQAYAFLTEGAFLLKESGYGVLLPSWWGQRENSVGLSLHVSPHEKKTQNTERRLGLDAIVEFDWRVALGSELLSRDEFFKLVEMKRSLVNVRGEWIELSPKRVEEILTAIRSKPETSEMTLGSVLQLKLGRLGDKKLPVTNLIATGWVESFLSQLTDQEIIPNVDQPNTFRGSLRSYQCQGLSWLLFLGKACLGACLADDMGLGKTIQVLALMLQLQEENDLSGPVLLICPTSIVGNWRKEAERFAPSLKVLVHHGLQRYGGDDFKREAEEHQLVVSTYSLVHRDLEQLETVSWSGLVLDEAQNIKNPQAKQTKALKRLKAPRRIALTGTPVENRLQELWSIMEFLNPGYLGSEASFRRNYALPIERYRSSDAAEELRTLVQPFILRRLKTDSTVICDLPSKNEMKVYCTLTQEQGTLYQAAVQESLQRIENSEGISRKGEVLAALTRLKQICNHPAHYLADRSTLVNRSGKLTRLTEMLEEVLSEGDKALVFTQYVEMGKLIQKHLRETLSVNVSFLYGGVPSVEREKMIVSFQDDPSGPPIFILSLKAGGFGLNLTEACHVFHFDRWWNPAVEDQATDRAFRIGQTQSVAVYKFICAGTIEERIDELADRKKKLADAVIQSGDTWITEFTTENLRELFELRSEAIEG